MADCGVALYSNCNCEIDRTSETDLKQNTILSYKSYYIEKLRQQTIAEPFKNVVYEADQHKVRDRATVGHR